MKEKRNNLYYKIFDHIKDLGYFLIESPVHISKHTVMVELIIYKPKGITTEDCQHVMRSMVDIVKIELDNKNAIVAVSSPGLERVIKYKDEFFLFLDKIISIIDEFDKVQKGILKSCDEKNLTLKTKSEEILIDISKIKKAKLIYE